MITGIIYKYTSPSGKVYVGQTTNERHRRATWFCIKYRYAGVAINRARAKYGPENFTYEVLYKKNFPDKYSATIELDKMETYYIGYFDSYKHGYNNSLGGSVNRGAVHSKESIEKQRQAMLGRKQSKELIEKIRKALKGTKHSEQATLNSKRLRRSSGRLKKVVQLSLDHKVVNIWSCVAEAAEVLKIVDKNIYRAIKTGGKYKGFYWKHLTK